MLFFRDPWEYRGPPKTRDYFLNPVKHCKCEFPTVSFRGMLSMELFFGCSFLFQVTEQSLRRVLILCLKIRVKAEATCFLSSPALCYSSGTVFCVNTVFLFLSHALSSAHDLLFLSVGRELSILNTCLFGSQRSFCHYILMQSFENQWLWFNPRVHEKPSYSSLEKMRLRLCGSYLDLDC